jgi:N-acetylglucosamine kinase-like BadF-type ATPase
LGRLTLEAAAEGDGEARAALDEGARELASCVLSVAQRLEYTAGTSELALTGGLFAAGERVIRPLEKAIAEVLPDCRVLSAELPPAFGAALLALSLDGAPITTEIRATMARRARPKPVADAGSA